MLRGNYSDAEFKLDDVVEVCRRMWPGINKQGGIAKIIGIHRDNDSDSFLYDVRYIVVNGGEHNVNPIYITRKDDLSKAKREIKGRCSFCNSLIVDCKHDQTDLMNAEKNSSQQSADEMDVDGGAYEDAVDESFDSDGDSTADSETSLQLMAQDISRGDNIINDSERTQEINSNSIDYCQEKENVSPNTNGYKNLVTDVLSAIRSSDGIFSEDAPDARSEYILRIKALQSLFTPKIAMEMALQSKALMESDLQAHKRMHTKVNNLRTNFGRLPNEPEYDKIIRNLDAEKEKLFRLAERSSDVCFKVARKWWLVSYFNRQCESMRTVLKSERQQLWRWDAIMYTNEELRKDVKKAIIESFKSLQDDFFKKFGYYPYDREYDDLKSYDDVNNHRPPISLPPVTAKVSSNSRTVRVREQDHGAYKKVTKKSDHDDSAQDSRKSMNVHDEEEFNADTDLNINGKVSHVSHKNRKKTPEIQIQKTFRVHGKQGKDIVSMEKTVERNRRFRCNKEALRKLLPAVPESTSKPASEIPVSKVRTASSTSFRTRNLRIVHQNDSFSYDDLGALFKDFYNAENEEIPVDVSNPKENTLTYRINYMRALHHSTVRTLPEIRSDETAVSIPEWADIYVHKLWNNAPNNATCRQFILGLQPLLQQSVLRICSNMDLLFSAGSVDWKTPEGEKIENIIKNTMLSLQKLNCICSQSVALLVLETKDVDTWRNFFSLLRSIDSTLLAKFYDLRKKILDEYGSLSKNVAYDFSLFAYLSFNIQRSASISTTFSKVLDTMRAERLRLALQHEVSGPVIVEDTNLFETLRFLFNEQKAIFDSCVRFLLTNPRLLTHVVTELNDVVLDDIGRLSDVNNLGEFQTGKSRLALHIICYYQLVLNALDSMEKEIRKDLPDRFKIWDHIEKTFSSISSQSSKYSEIWAHRSTNTGKALVGVPNPSICHDEDAEKSSMNMKWEYLWGICIVTSYLLYSIRLNDKTNEKRIENNHRIVRSLCTFACDRVVSAKSPGTLSLLGDELKQLYKSLYRLSNLAFVVNDTVNLHYVSIYLNCVSKVACYVSTLPFKASDDTEGVNVNNAAKAAKSVISVSFLAFNAGRSCSANRIGGNARVVSQLSWKESIDLLKNRLHNDLLAAVNCLFDHCNLLNPYRLYNLLEGPLQRRDSIDVLEELDDIEKLRSILRNLLWNLTHTCTTSVTGNYVVPHYTKNMGCIGELEEIIFNKKNEILNIFKHFPSFTTGLLVAQILKELRLIGANITDKDLSLYSDLQKAFLDSALVGEQLSCLLWFTAAIGANPYPIKEDDNKFCNTREFIKEQKEDQGDLSLLCVVVGKTQSKFFQHFRGDPTHAKVALTMQLMNTAISACSSLIHYHIQFLRKCSEAATSKYRAVVLPKDLLSWTLTLLVTSIGSAGSSLVTVPSNGFDSHIAPTIYLTTAIIEYLLGWVQYQIQLAESEKDPDCLGDNKVHMKEVQENRKVDLAAVESSIALIKKDLLPSFKIIFSKASLHKMDCLKEDYQIYTEFPQSTHSDVAYGPTSDIGNDREILNRLKSSDCCVAVVRAYESFIRLQQCTYDGTLLRQSSNENQLFKDFYEVIDTLQMKFAADNALVVSFSQCWYKILFLNPLFELLYSYDSDTSNRVISSSPTVEACSKRMVSVVYTINAPIVSLLQSTKVLDYYKTFLMVALTEPVMPSVCSRIQFSRFCHNLLVFSCVLIESSADLSAIVAAVLPYARLYVGSCLEHGMLVHDSSSWIAKAAESFLHHCIDFRDLHRVVKLDWKLNICDVFRRVIKFIQLCSFHVRLNKKHYSDVSIKYKAMCAVVVRKCRLSQIQRADDSSLITTMDQDQLLNLFIECIWGDANESLKLLFVHKYMQLATTPITWTVEELSKQLLGTGEGGNHASEIDRQLRMLDNLCHYIVLTFSLPYSTRRNTWLCLLQLLVISTVNCPALDHAHDHGTAYNNPTLALIHRLEWACQDVGIIWAAAVCQMPPEMEQQDRDLKSFERMEHILEEKLRSRFVFLQNASVDRLKTICESVSAVARGRSCNYLADRSNKLNSTDSFRNQFLSFLLEDPSDLIWGYAQDQLLQLFEDGYSSAEVLADKCNFITSCVRWQQAKIALIGNISAMETAIQEAWTSFSKSDEELML